SGFPILALATLCVSVVKWLSVVSLVVLLGNQLFNLTVNYLDNKMASLLRQLTRVIRTPIVQARVCSNGVRLMSETPAAEIAEKKETRPTVRKPNLIQRNQLKDFGKYVGECLPKFIQKVQI
ncbi:hypothetical protein AMK59_2349, partial [Oryctes borbonicus]